MGHERPSPGRLSMSGGASGRRAPGGGAPIGCAVLAGAAFLVRIGAWQWLAPANLIGDMEGYLRQALVLASGRQSEDTFIPPGYPAVLAVALRLLGPNLDAAASFLHAALGSLTVISTFLAARLLLRPSLAVPAAAVVAFDPTEVAYSTMLLSESLAAALVAAAAAALARRSLAGSLLAGLFLGAAALTRESVVLLLLLVGVAQWREGGWRLAMAFLIAACLPIAPWTVRNARLTGRPILVSTRTGYNLLIGNNPYADGTQRGGKRIFALADPPVPESLPAVERHERGSAYAFSWARAHPQAFLRKGIAGALRMFGLERQLLYSLREGYYARRLGRVEKLMLAAGSLASWIFVFPLLVLGLLVAPRGLRALGLCAVLWLGLLGFVAFGEWRFRMPVLPVLTLLAVAGGDAWLHGRVARRAWVVAAALVAPVVASWIGEVLARAPDLSRL